MRFSLYIRALLLVGLVLGGVTVTFVSVETYREQQQLTHELETRLDRLTNLLSASVAEMVWVLNRESARNILSSLRQDPDFFSANIATDSDEAFVQIGKADKSGSPVVTAQAEIRFTSGDTENVLGMLTVSLSKARLFAKQKYTLKRAVVLGAIQLVAVLFVTALMLRRLIDPMESITGRLIGLAGGEIETDIPSVNRDDQIGDMARAVRAFRESLTEISRLRDKDKKQAGELMESRDLLEQRVAERTRELREATQHLRDVAETTYDRFWEMDQNFRYTSFTDTPVKSGISTAPEMIGLTPWEYVGIDPEADSAWQQHRRELQQYRRFRDFEYSTTDESGLTHYFRVSGKPVFDDAGCFAGYRGSATNITERRRAEIEQRKNEALINAVIEHSPVAMSIKDLDGNYLYVSPMFAEYSGCTVADLTGKNFRDVYDTDQASVIDAADRQVAEAGKPLAVEDLFAFTIGGRSLLITKFPIMDEHNIVTAIGTVGLDVTEQEIAREELRRANDELENKVRERTSDLVQARDVAEAANELKSQLITTMSHELRTPLTSIVGSLRMLSQGVIKGIPDEANNLIEMAWRNSDQLARLVNDILDVERLSAGALELHLEKVDLSELLKLAVELNAGYASEHKVGIVIKEFAPGIVVDGDYARLLQVMANLLSNASKFSPEGTEVETSLTQHGQVVTISVTDHGIGIPEELRESLFDKFVRGDTHDNRNRGGAGLGLGITKAIVEKHNGRIRFVSELGAGTTFYVELPKENP